MEDELANLVYTALVGGTGTAAVSCGAHAYAGYKVAGWESVDMTLGDIKLALEEDLDDRPLTAYEMGKKHRFEEEYSKRKDLSTDYVGHPSLD